MNIQEWDINRLKPYENNPRYNDDAVEAVANSIREFGFKQPIVVDKDGVIVCGHTRHKGALQLGLKKVPVLVADDLTDEQIKAYRLADNKVSELAEWNEDALKIELDGILDIDMSMFDFDIEDESDFADLTDGEEENERVRTGDAYNLGDYDETRVAGFYQFPTLKPCKFIPKELIGFNYMLTSQNKEAGIHFYVDDYQFERIWNDPWAYIPKMKEYSCALTPDFSLYMDMPRAMKIWNIYRSRMIGQMLQDAGMEVIPTLMWAEQETLDFCFEGLPKNSVVSVSTIGVKTDPIALETWYNGMDKAIEVLKPKTILLYGGRLEEYDFGDIEIIEFKNGVTERMKASKKNDKA